MSDDLIDLGGGQTRMEVAYGSDDGDTDSSAIVAKKEASLGAIFEQNGMVILALDGLEIMRFSGIMFSDYSLQRAIGITILLSD